MQLVFSLKIQIFWLKYISITIIKNIKTEYLKNIHRINKYFCGEVKTFKFLFSNDRNKQICNFSYEDCSFH